MTVRRVAILGAESSGKSTLAAALAERYQTVWVPEYLREFVDVKGRVPREEDQVEIARMQMAREEAAALEATGWLFCDTTPMMTALYSRWYWNRVDWQLAQLEARHAYAFTFVTAPDAPWEADGLQRESDAVRQTIHQQVMQMLDDRRIPFVLLSGDLDARVHTVMTVLPAGPV